MIYEYIEMAEKDLIADSYNYEYVVHSDIKNFYPSVYTHTISWALKGREWSRKNRWPNDKTFTNRLDRLLQYSHDGCTNGIPIGSALSDLISELILTTVDKNITQHLTLSNIEFHGVRFKDDYRVLVKNQEDGKKVIECIQDKLAEYRLQIHEDKTSIEELPNGLYREHIMRYAQYSFKGRQPLSFKEFEKIYYEVLKIDADLPNKGVIDKFLGELVRDPASLKLNALNIDFGAPSNLVRNIAKFVSLLWKMYNRRPKVLPNILGIFEILLQSDLGVDCIVDLINTKVRLTYNQPIKIDFFFLCWAYYLFKTNNISVSEFKDDKRNLFWNSIFSNKNLIFPESKKIYQNIKKCKSQFGNINSNIALFQKEYGIDPNPEVAPLF